MQRLIFLLMAALATAPAIAQAPLGIYHRWGAFTQADAKRCYALSKAVSSAGRRVHQPYASVSFSPERGGAPQFYVRLSNRKRAGSAVILRIDDRAFQLIGQEIHAWAPDAAADTAIIGAMRTGVALSVETRSEGGTRVRDRYVLRGAASAIDSAAFACASPRRWKKAAARATWRQP
ncbi:MAG TPA: hypothetical protein VGR19_06300 [Allosphingosinicella sp.]|nr:hypothetical protein [Allosphingosinicella sp.]